MLTAVPMKIQIDRVPVRQFLALIATGDAVARRPQRADDAARAWRSSKIRKQFREARTRLGITTRRLAYMAGYNESDVNSWMFARSAPTFAEIVTLARLLGLTIRAEEYIGPT